MSFIRLCAAFHSEGCSEKATPPGPCLDVEDCEDIVCNPRLQGSCGMDQTLSWCSDVQCDFLQRQRRDVLGSMQQEHRMG